MTTVTSSEPISFRKHLHKVFSIIQECRFTHSHNPISEEKALELACNLIQETAKNNGTIYTIGNGGSNSTASHFTLEILKNLRISAVALTDSSLLTSISNDLAFEKVYSLPIDVMCKEHDLLFVLSGSGKSPNLLQAVHSARRKGTKVITLSGCDPFNPLQGMGDLNFWINSQEHSLIEIAHFFLLHTIIDRCLENHRL